MAWLDVARRASRSKTTREVRRKMKTLSLNVQRPRRAVFQPHRSVRCDAAPLEKPAGTRLFVGRRFGITLEDHPSPGRKLKDYVRLPAERYNVLDSKAVTRVGENSFRVSTGVQRMPFFEAEPTGLIEIEVLPDGVRQSLKKAELLSPKPNKVVDEINRTMGGLSLTNMVTSGLDSEGRTQLQCQLVLNGLFTHGVMAKVPEDRLNGMMAWALGLAMPWFLTKLREDYNKWSRGEDRRMAVGTGEMSALAAQAARGGKSTLPQDVEELPLVGADAVGAARAVMQPPSEGGEGGAAAAEAPPPSRAPWAGPKGFGKK